jgi:hypothetical protein
MSMFMRGKFDKLIIPMIFVGVFCFFSYRPHFEIVPQMPKEFPDRSASNTRHEQAAEETLAQRYWKCVVTTIQWKYRFGETLPATPPAEFVIANSDGGDDAAARLRYWGKVHEVWYLSSTWQKQYKWSTAWITTWTDDIRAVGSWFYSRLPS